MIKKYCLKTVSMIFLMSTIIISNYIFASNDDLFEEVKKETTQIKKEQISQKNNNNDKSLSETKELRTVLAVLPKSASTANLMGSTPIRAGDVINVTMQEDEEVKYQDKVSAGGLIFLPYLGSVFVAGKSEIEAEAYIAKELEKDLYQKATISVSIVTRAPGNVYVYGAVKIPGKVALPEVGEMNILQLLAEVHGVTTWAEPQESYILRQVPGKDKRKKIHIDIMKAFKEIDGAENKNLRNNDVIFIPSSTGFDSILSNEVIEVIVTGEVRAPGLIEFAPGEQRTFVRAIFKAGNFTQYAKKKKVRLIRYNKDGSRKVIVINATRVIDEGFLEEDIAIQPGDMIIVDESRW